MAKSKLRTRQQIWAACKDFFASWRRWRLLSIIVTAGVLALVITGYWWPATGFGGYYNSQHEWQREKTIWDWMDLVLVPLILAVGAAWLASVTNRREREIEERRLNKQQQIELDHSREAALQGYLDRITELLKEGLRTSERGDEVRQIARARTLTVLRQLDGERKGLLLRFLHEAHLIGEAVKENRPRKPAVIALKGADLSRANLSGAWLVFAMLDWADLGKANLSQAVLGSAHLEETKLCKADLSQADLVRADLYGANLREANLTRADLRWANLLGADLRGANLTGADLREADLGAAKLDGVDLNMADLSEANLSWANLQASIVTPEQLAQARNLEGATMPDGTAHK